ncbi:MAG: hypothetical protein Q8N02_11315 [Methylotenera sp.]|nr:hypothetical protein [Methylotenera sp.]MDP2403105.1 hypothetical protein [Methylotenera sp.]MDP3096148.1 hypothetical protein [Methylotenera sp.]MDZ4223063.1 hypothetical protein [Methylotenera sp.]
MKLKPAQMLLLKSGMMARMKIARLNLFDRFFEVFGITNKRVATFEHAVKKHGGNDGYVDLFWSGILLVEMK